MSTSPTFIYSRICTLAALAIGGLIAWFFSAPPLAASILISGVLIGIKLDNRHKYWWLIIATSFLVNAASYAYLLLWIPFSATFTIWTLGPTFAILFSGMPKPHNHE